MKNYIKPHLNISACEANEVYCNDLVSGVEIATDFGLNYGTEDEYVRGL